MELEAEWQKFIAADLNDEDYENIDNQLSQNNVENNRVKRDVDAPSCTELKISTKSKIIYLNQKFDLESLFWKLKIINYDEEKEGIIKKQMKFNFQTPEEVVKFENNIKNETCVNVTIINQINNPTGHVSFKDVRKVDIGISKNDVLKPNKSSKSAFYNCFVIIFRKIHDGCYREFHVKLFNSGKVEIPGIQNEEMLEIALDILIETVQPHCN